ncbi:ubiquitin carboxyl-terminal hydrolase 12-like isoform X2 [Orbicella faveolata]|nr:ubiquitin carboxyl-terminal hydrolase 12-like isoform X2 [Orbicella faveolata]
MDEDSSENDLLATKSKDSRDDKMQATAKKGQTESIISPSLNYVGLKNIANNCWFNAVVQVLTHCSFGAWLTDTLGVTTLPRDLLDLATSITKLSQTQRPKTINPSSLLRTFHNRNPGMLPGLQHDAHEGLVQLLNGIVTEDTRWTPLQAMVQNARECTRCNQVIVGTEEWRHFVCTASMQGCNSVQDCILNIGPQGNKKLKLHCNRCKEYTICKVWSAIVEKPQLLIIQLMRFHNGGEKLNREIQVSQEMDISSVCSIQPGRDPCYRLVAAVLHHGGTSRSGHYTALVKVHGCWHLFDDEKISTLNNGQVKAKLEQSGYLLFYEEKKEEQELKTPSGEYSSMDKGKSIIYFFYCRCTEAFWPALTSWLRKQNIFVETLTLMSILFSEFSESKGIIILNHLILMAKFYIYKCKLNNMEPSLKVFVAKVKIVQDIERQITVKRNKMTTYNKKWEKLLTCNFI